MRSIILGFLLTFSLVYANIECYSNEAGSYCFGYTIECKDNICTLIYLDEDFPKGKEIGNFKRNEDKLFSLKTLFYDVIFLVSDGKLKDMYFLVNDRREKKVCISSNYTCKGIFIDNGVVKCFIKE